jgi:DNA polymerase-3 subunit alpha
LEKNGYIDLVSYDTNTGRVFMDAKSWDKIYQAHMNVFREWLKVNQNEILTKLNKLIFKDEWDKYAKKGSLSAWEMEVLCFYYHEHELVDVDMERYGLKRFSELPIEPVVERTFYKGDHAINLFQISRICGTCIAKNKIKSSVTLLTTDGVVEVKFAKNYFALFDKRISAVGEDGKNHVVEHSWFNRGSMIIVTGIRSGDTFLAKKYASTPGHTLYHIDEVNGKEILIRTARALGDMEDDD